MKRRCIIDYKGFLDYTNLNELSEQTKNHGSEKITWATWWQASQQRAVQWYTSDIC